MPFIPLIFLKSLSTSKGPTEQNTLQPSAAGISQRCYGRERLFHIISNIWIMLLLTGEKPTEPKSRAANEDDQTTAGWRLRCTAPSIKVHSLMEGQSFWSNRDIQPPHTHPARWGHKDTGSCWAVWAVWQREKRYEAKGWVTTSDVGSALETTKSQTLPETTCKDKGNHRQRKVENILNTLFIQPRTVWKMHCTMSVMPANPTQPQTNLWHQRGWASCLDMLGRFQRLDPLWVTVTRQIASV